MTLELAREQTVQALCAHYARDHLTTGELERRFDRAHKARSAAELTLVLSGLPALHEPSAGVAPLYRTAPRGGLAPGESRYLSFFGEVRKTGAWTPTRTILAKAIFGTLVLDLREAELPLEGIDLDLDVIFGECTVILPHGVGAEMDVTATMATATDKAQRASPGGPVVRIRGQAVFGEVTVRTELPQPARLERWRDQLKGLLRGG